MFAFGAAVNAKLQTGTQVTATGTAGALKASSPTIPAKAGVYVQALSTNTASVFLGPSGVTTTTGLEITPGSTVTVPVADPSGLYVITAGTSQKVNTGWI